MGSLKQRFGQLVAAHRKAVGYTQFGLSTRAGISVDMVSKIEGGTSGARFATVEKLAEALGVDPAQLFSPDLGGKPFDRRALTDLVSDLSRLSDADLQWVRGIIKAALDQRG